MRYVGKRHTCTDASKNRTTFHLLATSRDDSRLLHTAQAYLLQKRALVFWLSSMTVSTCTCVTVFCLSSCWDLPLSRSSAGFCCGGWTWVWGVFQPAYPCAFCCSCAAETSRNTISALTSICRTAAEQLGVVAEWWIRTEQDREAQKWQPLLCEAACSAPPAAVPRGFCPPGGGGRL